MKKKISMQGALGIQHPLIKIECEKRLVIYRVLIKNNFKDIKCSSRVNK